MELVPEAHEVVPQMSYQHRLEFSYLAQAMEAPNEGFLESLF